jgi:hypothetical protein
VPPCGWHSGVRPPEPPAGPGAARGENGHSLPAGSAAPGRARRLVVPGSRSPIRRGARGLVHGRRHPARYPSSARRHARSYTCWNLVSDRAFAFALARRAWSLACCFFWRWFAMFDDFKAVDTPNARRRSSCQCTGYFVTPITLPNKEPAPFFLLKAICQSSPISFPTGLRPRL